MKIEQAEGNMPPQTQSKPGLESEMHPRPLYMAPSYRGCRQSTSTATRERLRRNL